MTHNPIPKPFLDELRDRVDLPELIGRTVALKRSGRSFTGLCPFHEDKSPSFTVYPDGRYRCYGCPAKGDAISWVRHTDKLDFREAVVVLAESCGMKLPAPPDERPAADRQRVGAIHSAIRQAEGLYQYGLQRDQEALAYLRNERGLTDQTIKQAGLGVVGHGIARVLRGRLMDARAIEWAGLVSSHESHSVEIIRHRLVIPLRNAKGVTVGFAGRALLGRGSDKPKYLNTPETELFKKGHELFGFDLAKPSMVESRSGVVVEGYFDVLSLRQAGEGRAVAAMGTSLTVDQAARLWRTCDTVTLGMDGDAAGVAGALAAAKVLLSQMRDGKFIRVCLLPAGEDPDSIVRHGGIDEWRAALAGARHLSDLLVGQLTEGLDDSSTPEEVVPIAIRAREWLDACAHAPTYRQALAAHFQVRLGIAL